MFFEAIHRLHAKHIKWRPDAQPSLAVVARMILDQGCRPEEIMAARLDSFNAKDRTLRSTFMALAHVDCAISWSALLRGRRDP